MFALFFLLFLFLVVFGFIQWLRDYGQRMKYHHHYTRLCPKPEIDRTDIVFTGEQLALTNQKVDDILTKRFPYYRNLAPELKQMFIERLQKFMFKKTFIIKDDEGFKDMPVLVSAAAIQLTFGLNKFRLPFYKYIRIFPAEYFSDQEFLRVLAGNVQNNVISIAWNHLLTGYENDSDGKNIPLHEMSHALYIQEMVIDINHSELFQLKYQELHGRFRIAHSMESQGDKDHYSEYAETNLQEFWAESVELFFEKPNELFEQYPQVFEAMKELLNQDPRNSLHPVLQKNEAFLQKAGRLVNRVLDRVSSEIGMVIMCICIYPG